MGALDGSGWVESWNPQSPSDYQGISAATRCDGEGFEVDQQLKRSFPDLWSPRGSCCREGGDCKESNTSAEQNIRWVLPRPDAAIPSEGPESVVGDGAVPMRGRYTVRIQLPSEARSKCTRQNGPCTIQWLYMTGNSPDSYPEAFKNCADFTIKESMSRASDASDYAPSLRR